MEYLERITELKKKTTLLKDTEMKVDLIDGIRLSLRFVNKETPDQDILINLTKEETEKIKRVLNGRL